MKSQSRFRYDQSALPPLHLSPPAVLLAASWALIVLLLGCTGDSAPDDPRAQFALEQIRKRPDPPSVAFALDQSMAEQEFAIVASGGSVSITGGDAVGLMYGGLEAAEQIDLYGQVRTTKGAPKLARRGVKFNIPLDARTPSYDDSGDAAQKNIAEMWDWQFWEQFLDTMAVNRYNVLTFWNPHPFPSMIKLDDYPDVALDDVKATTLSPTGVENEWGDPQLVTTNVMANLETVKTITIDEKIAFWQRVMRRARDRGIDVYWITWNICPNSVALPVEPFYKTFGINLADEAPGKHGVTHQIDNPITVDYHRQAVKTFLLTYPDVTGIGVTAGEHMPQSWEGVNREEWLWNTYGQGILDAKQEQPDRTVRFIHRVWHSDMDQIMDYWGDYPDPFEVSFKYAHARLYSSPQLPFAAEHIAQMQPYGLKSWWNLRNDDIFVYRWGDPEYVRDFLNFFDEDATAGYYVGSDGYVWGREFISKNPALSGQLEIDKHWYRFLLWGRLGYDDALDRSFFVKKLAKRYPDAEAGLLFDVWRTASQIIPKINVFHWRDWDADWSVEAGVARPQLGGYREVTDFIDNPTLEGSGIASPAELAAGPDRGERSPRSVVEELHGLARQTRESAQRLRRGDMSEELRTLLEDFDAMAAMADYYASKIHAAIELAQYRLTRNASERSAAVGHLEEALSHWDEYTRISVANYQPQMLARPGLLDWEARRKDVERDIEIAREFQPNP